MLANKNHKKQKLNDKTCPAQTDKYQFFFKTNNQIGY